MFSACDDEDCPCAGEAGPATEAWAAPVDVAAADAVASWSTLVVRWGLPEVDMVVEPAFLVLLLLLVLLLIDAEDPVLDVGGAFPGTGGWEVTVAAFNPEEALLVVVGAADIDAIWNNQSIRCCYVMLRH